MAVKYRVTLKKTQNLSHWNVIVLLPINSERAHTEVRTNPFHWLYSFQQPTLHYSLQLMPQATVWLLRRFSSTWYIEVGKANEQQELVKLLWQLEVWPSGVWSALFHSLWFPVYGLWQVTLAWWAHMLPWGSSILQHAGRCAVNPSWPSF